MSVTLPNSHEYELEQAIYGILADINNDVTTSPAISIYTQNRIGAKVSPYITISAKTQRQLIQPYSGVYEMEATIEVVMRTFNASLIDEVYQYVVALLYDEATTLVQKIQFNSTNLKTYMARITSQTPSIKTNRGHKQSLVITAIVTPSAIGDGLRFLDFSNYLNSQYVALV
jgi:hypothetical protein